MSDRFRGHRCSRPGSFLYACGRAPAGVLGWVGRGIARTISGRWRCERGRFPKQSNFTSCSQPSSRNGHDFTERFPSIAQLLHELPAKAPPEGVTWVARHACRQVAGAVDLAAW